MNGQKNSRALKRVCELSKISSVKHYDIYIMTKDGSEVYQLTNLKTKKNIFDPSPTTGILQPHFSNDGAYLSWAERIDKGGKWGEWVIRIANFKVADGIPMIDSMQTFQPGVNHQYVESNDFMPDDKRLLICGNLEPKQTEYGIDIYLFDIESSELKRLTATQDVFEECPHPSPDGKMIAYLSTEGFPILEKDRQWWNWAKGEFWLMDSAGGNNQRLTYFNEPGHEEYVGKRTIPANISWNKDGTKLLVSVVVETKKGVLEDRIYLIELNQEQ